MKKQIAGLEFMPERAPLVSEEKWRSQGIRKLTVKNYLVYFRVDDSNRTVWITAVVNSRRSQPEQLEAMPL